MTKKHILILSIFFLFLTACSSNKNRSTISVTSATSGLVKNGTLPFPIFLTDKIIAKKDIIKETSDDVFVIHTGHILNPKAKKSENEKILESLSDKNIDLVSLSLEDFIIANAQDISFEKYPQKFLNSSVVDLNEDNIISKKNISAYFIIDGVAFIGLSDKKYDKSLSLEKFLVSDYVLAILRAKKAALKDPEAHENSDHPLQSFVLIHTIKDEINEIMDRLPPNFINSLAD